MWRRKLKLCAVLSVLMATLWLWQGYQGALWLEGWIGTQSIGLGYQDLNHSIWYIYYWLVVTGTMEFYDFPCVGNGIIIPTDELIFFWGVETTNQISWGDETAGQYCWSSLVLLQVWHRQVPCSIDLSLLEQAKFPQPNWLLQVGQISALSMLHSRGTEAWTVEPRDAQWGPPYPIISHHIPVSPHSTHPWYDICYKTVFRTHSDILAS